MLFFTPTMRSSLALVFVTIFSIHCHAITVRDDDDGFYGGSPKIHTYHDSDLEKPEAEYRVDDYYKPLRRSDDRTYQYSEESNEDPDYSQPQSDQNSETYPYTERTDRQQTTRRRTVAKTPYVEQYLKEVTPTTKTAYNQRPGNYLRLREQAGQKAVKEQTEELQEGILKQPSVQYALQSNLQEKPRGLQQVQYVIANQKTTQYQQKEQPQPPQTGTLTAFQNAILAHQKVLETESQDETSRSSIYVTHSIPKKPVRKIVKPTPADEDVEQYAQLQQYEIQQKQANIYEPRESAHLTYQAKIQYANEDANFQATTEVPNYQREKELKQLRQQIQDIIQYQQAYSKQPIYQEDKLIRQQPQQLAMYQQLLSNSQAKISRPIKLTNYQPSESSLEFKIPSKITELAPVQFQQSSYLKKGPKYLPEPKAQYQPSGLDETEDKFKQIVNIPGQHPEPLITYEAAIAKLQAEKLLQARQERPRPQATYQQQQQSSQAKFTLDYPDPETKNVNAPNRDYVRIGGTNKYRANANPLVSYRQSQENANDRYFRNPARPSISYSLYQ